MRKSLRDPSQESASCWESAYRSLRWTAVGTNNAECNFWQDVRGRRGNDFYLYASEFGGGPAPTGGLIRTGSAQYFSYRGEPCRVPELSPRHLGRVMRNLRCETWKSAGGGSGIQPIRSRPCPALVAAPPIIDEGVRNLTLRRFRTRVAMNWIH
jgi:hypothetical protein